MAKFEFNGMDEICASFEQLANITDEDKMSVIMPAARLLADLHKEKVKALFRQISGNLAGSISIQRKSDDDGVYASIYMKGKHPSSGTGKRKHKHSNGEYSGTNAEVGYILEYGSPRIAATHWMENANEEAADDVVATQQAAWDEMLERKGL